MFQLLEKALLERWSEFFPREKPPQRLTVAIISSSREPQGTRILLVFSDHQAVPCVVGKVARDPRADPRLEQESRRLQLLQSGLPEVMRAMLPRPLPTIHVHQTVVHLQTALVGQNMKTLIQRGEHAISPSAFEADLLHLERWLDQFWTSKLPNSEERKGLVPDAINVSDLSLSALSSLKKRGILLPEARLFAALMEDLEPMLRSRPPCWVHGDLWPGNVMIDGPRWSILDWDDVSIGHRWQDPFWFALQYGALVHSQLLPSHDLVEGLRQTLFERQALNEVFGQYLRRTVQNLGLDPAISPKLVVFLLVRAAGDWGTGARQTWFNGAAAEMLRRYESGASLALF